MVDSMMIRVAACLLSLIPLLLLLTKSRTNYAGDYRVPLPLRSLRSPLEHRSRPPC